MEYVCVQIYLLSQLSLQKWYVDANTKCFHGSHAAIGTIAIIFLILSVSFVPFVGFACDKIILKV